MLSLDEMKRRIEYLEANIQRMKDEDAGFPADPIYTREIKNLTAALEYRRRKYQEAGGET